VNFKNSVQTYKEYIALIVGTKV